MAELATIARPYAKALFELASEKGQVELWLQKLKDLAWAVGQPKLTTLLDDAGIAPHQKADALIGLLDDIQAPQYTDFKNFQALVLAKDHIQKAIIYSAFPMSEGQFAKVVSDCQQKFGHKLEATLKVVPELIGGIKIEVGDKVLDLSVRGKLKNLYTAMIN